MASVSRCDCCGKIGNHEDYQFLKLFTEKRTGSVDKIYKTLELCPECVEKVLEIFNKYGSE